MEDQTDINKHILEKIHTDKLVMRSKTYFQLKVVALIVVAFLVMLVSGLLFNFILFSIHSRHHESFLSFGTHGIWLFIQFFPWFLFALDLALLAILEWLLRQFRFGYKRPTLYLIIGLVIVIVPLGLFINHETSVNDRLTDRAHRRPLPPPLGFYQHARRPLPLGSVVCRCVVTVLAPDAIIAYNADIGQEAVETITIPPPFVPIAQTFKVGDTIFVAGEKRGDVIIPFGIKHE